MARTRTIVYPPRPGTAPPAAPETPETPDTFPDKLTKYVPAEVVAFYAPLYATLTSYAARVVVFSAAIVGLLAYLWLRAPKAEPPRWYFYVLGVVSFVGWALTTSTVGADLLHLGGPDVAKIALPIAVFVVPAIDEALTRAGI